MVVNNLYVDRTGRILRPFEADAPLIVDSNAVLSASVTLQLLKSVRWWNPQRIEAAGIGYLAIVGGETLTSETKGRIGCFAGYGGGGCIGILWWDHESHLSALVVDMRSGSERLKEGVDAAGTSWFGILAAFPLAAPSLHETKGCERFGNAVASALVEMHRQGE